MVQLSDTELQVSTRLAYVDELSAQYAIPNVELLQYTDPKDIMESVLLRLLRKVAYIPGTDTISIPEVSVPQIRVPDGCWQSFKAQYLSRWLSVRYRTLQEPRVIAKAATYEARAYLTGLNVAEGRYGPIVLRWQESRTLDV